jgi:hypothetical protein
MDTIRKGPSRRLRKIKPMHGKPYSHSDIGNEWIALRFVEGRKKMVMKRNVSDADDGVRC